MANMEEYKVDKNLCIDCNACYTTYPEIFKQVPWQGETKAEAHAPVEQGKYNPWDVLGCCPTDAISKIGEMPPKPVSDKTEEAAAPLQDLGPWEERWERVKHLADSKWEIMKRYGMAATISEEKDKYIVLMEFPEKSPIHKLTYQMGLPDKMPEYKYEVLFDENRNELLIKGFLTDAHFKNLTGKINSFPDRFRRAFKLPGHVTLGRQTYRDKILRVELVKDAAPAMH